MSWRSSRTEAPARPVLVGRVRRPHGLRGEVLVEVLSAARHRFDPGSSMWCPESGGGLEVETARAGTGTGTLLVRFAGFASPEDAVRLRGGQLQIDSSEVEPAPDGSFYPHELLGARCVDLERGDLGVIEDLVDAGGGPLLVVRRDGREVLVPFVERFVRGLDRGERRLDVELPAGLVED